MVWRRLWLVILILIASLGTASYVSRHTPKRWRANAAMILVQRATTVAASAQAGYAAPMIESPETQVSMLQSYAMAQRAIDFLKNQAIARGQSGESIGINAEQLQQAITVSTPKDTNIIDVLVEAESRERAATLANAVCQAFVQWKSEVAKQDVQDTTNSLAVRANRAKAQMLTAEQRETEFKRQHQLVDVPAQQKAALEQYQTRDAEVVSLTQDMASDEAKLKSLGDRLKAANAAIKGGTGVRDDTLVLNLQQQLSQLEIERASLAQKYTPEYPGMLPDIDAKIADVKGRLSKAVQSTLDNKKPSLQAQGALFEDYKQAQTTVLFQRAKLNAAVQFRDQLKQQLAGLPQVSRDYAGLVRESELATSLYGSLQSALNSARLNQDMASGNVQMAQYAFVPEKPFQPDPKRDLLLGGAAGVFLSMLAVLLLEQSDRRVRDVDKARSLLGGPIVGALPKMSQGEMRAMREGRTPPQAIEAYSLARANLTLAVRAATNSEPWHKQILMVTSAVPGEGKSVTAAELARSLARAGKSVILVDADMRRPSQNRLFRTEEPNGLADVLAGEMTLDDALVASDTENLSILHSGTPGRNPSELISQPQMLETLSALRQEADVVIIDTPAAATVADALLLVPHVDCVLHVVGAGKVDEDTVRESTASLSAAAPKTMVYFLNRASKERGYYGKYYYRQGVYRENDLHEHKALSSSAPPAATTAAEPSADPVSQAAATAPPVIDIPPQAQPPTRTFTQTESHEIGLEDRPWSPPPPAAPDLTDPATATVLHAGPQVVSNAASSTYIPLAIPSHQTRRAGNRRLKNSGARMSWVFVLGATLLIGAVILGALAWRAYTAHNFMPKPVHSKHNPHHSKVKQTHGNGRQQHSRYVKRTYGG